MIFLLYLKQNQFKREKLNWGRSSKSHDSKSKWYFMFFSIDFWSIKQCWIWFKDFFFYLSHWLALGIKFKAISVQLSCSWTWFCRFSNFLFLPRKVLVVANDQQMAGKYLITASLFWLQNTNRKQAMAEQDLTWSFICKLGRTSVA